MPSAAPSMSPAATRAVFACSFSAAATGSRPRPQSRELALLTPREPEVVNLVALGLSNTEIAARLVLSPLTAKTHVSRAMAKVGARDRAQLVVFAYQSGLLSPRQYGSTPGP